MLAGAGVIPRRRGQSKKSFEREWMQYWRISMSMMMKLFKQVSTVVLCGLLVQFTAQAESYGPSGQSSGGQESGQSSDQAPAPPVKQSPQELQQLVAPIALYPDALVAQVLAASTYPIDLR